MTSCLQAEARAEFAERSMTKLEKNIEKLDGELCLNGGGVGGHDASLMMDSVAGLMRTH